MGVDYPGNRCRWIHDRLPLLAGGELTGADRRKVERHLIACPACREHERSLAGALGALQAAATVSPAGLGRVDAPSLWPALARQIREARHDHKPASWFDIDTIARLLTRPFSPSPSLRLRPAWVLGAALILVAITAAGIDSWSRSRVDELAAQPFVVGEAEPFAFAEEDDFSPDLSMSPTLPPVMFPSPAPQPPLSGRDLVRDDAPVAPVIDHTASRFDYDLDHGTPMGPDGVDVKASY